MEIDTSKTITYEISRIIFISVGILAAVSAVFFSYVIMQFFLKPELAKNIPGWFNYTLNIIILLSVIGLYLSAYYLFRGAIRASRTPLHISPEGIFCKRVSEEIIEWKNISSINLAKPYRSPPMLIISLKELPDNKRNSTTWFRLRQFLKGVRINERVLALAHFAEKGIPITEAVEAYAEKYGGTDLAGKAANEIISDVPYGIKWFWKSKQVPKWKKTIIACLICIMGGLIAFSIPGLSNASNAFVAVEFWQDFQPIHRIIVICSFFLSGYLFTWFKYPLFATILLSPFVGLVTAIGIALPLMYGVPITLDQFTNQKIEATREFSILTPRANWSKCPQNAIKIESRAPDKDFICAPVAIRSRAQKGDLIVLIGEKSYWAFRYHSVKLIRQ